MTEVELGALASGNLAPLGDRERAAVEFAEKVTRDSNRVADELFRLLRRHFNEGEIVEIAGVAGLFNYFNRLANALQLEPTK